MDESETTKKLDLKSYTSMTHNVSLMISKQINNIWSIYDQVLFVISGVTFI